MTAITCSVCGRELPERLPLVVCDCGVQWAVDGNEVVRIDDGDEEGEGVTYDLPEMED